MKSGNLVRSIAVVFAGMVSPSQAADPPVIDGNNVMQCDMGNERASGGQMPTAVANEFWSRIGCGDREAGFELLEENPKADIGMVPNPLAQSDLNSCYFNSFAYDRFSHDLMQDRLTGDNGVKHGLYFFTSERFQEIQGTMLQACQVKLGLD